MQFGSIRKLPSGRYQARYTHNGSRHTAPTTFLRKTDARAWLNREHGRIIDGVWKPPGQDSKPPTLAEYATEWMSRRKLAPKTRQDYNRLLRLHILPQLGHHQLPKIKPSHVWEWHAGLSTGPTAKAHAYSLLRAICNTAVRHELIPANPCRVEGAGTTKRASTTELVNDDELATIVAAMPERHRLMVQLAAWCALRFGELTELRAHDIDLDERMIYVRRGVVVVKDMPDTLPPDVRRCDCRPGCLVGPPKTDAGQRDVAIPAFLIPNVREHLDRYRVTGDRLLFPSVRGGHLSLASFNGKVTTPTKRGWGWREARRLAGREDLRFHDLRHTGATVFAATGATLKEIMYRVGHTTPSAALRYQHASRERQRELADKLRPGSQLADQRHR